MDSCALLRAVYVRAVVCAILICGVYYVAICGYNALLYGIEMGDSDQRRYYYDNVCIIRNVVN
jgi:hypothetical protein